ncbi:hypothetical protein Tco_1281571, partial [Tanacetum coccineum]
YHFNYFLSWRIFHMDVIDKVTKEELDALLDDSEPFSTMSEKISESSLDHEFKEFLAIKIEEIPEQEEEVEDNFEELPLEENLRIKNSIKDPLSCDETSSQTSGICFSGKRFSSSSSHIRSAQRR